MLPRVPITTLMEYFLSIQQGYQRVYSRIRKIRTVKHITCLSSENRNYMEHDEDVRITHNTIAVPFLLILSHTMILLSQFFFRLYVYLRRTIQSI